MFTWHDILGPPHGAPLSRASRPALADAGLPRILACFLLFALTFGCGGDHDDPKPLGVTYEVRVSPATAIPDQEVHLEVVPLAGDSSDLDYQWRFEDGSEANGTNVRRAFTHPGLASVELSVSRPGSRTELRRTSIAVLDHETGALPEFGDLPALLGDVDLDGVRTLNDLVTITRLLDEPDSVLSSNAWLAADFDINGRVDGKDIDLLAAAVLAEGPPSTIQPTLGPPGTLIRLHSPALLEPGQKIEVQVGVRRFMPTQFLLGQVSFFLPFDLDQPGSLEVTPGSRTIELLVDGSLREAFDFEVIDGGPAPEDPVGLMSEAMDLSDIALREIIGGIDTLLSSELALDVGVNDDERAVAVEFLRAIGSELEAVHVQIGPVMQRLDSAALPLLSAAMASSGLEGALDELRSIVRGSNANVPSLSAGAALDALCNLRALLRAWEVAGNAIETTCYAMTAAAVGLAFIPGIGLAAAVADLLLVFEICVPALSLTSAADLVFGILPRAGDHIELEVMPETPLAEGESAEIAPYLPIEGLARLCAFGGQLASSQFADLLSTRVVRELVSRGPLRPLAALSRLGFRQTYDRIIRGLGSTVSSLLGATPLGGWLSQLALDWCSGVDRWLQVPLDSFGIFLPQEPAIGSLSVPSAPGTGQPAIYTYFLNPDITTPAEGILIRARGSFCGGPLAGSTHIKIGEVPVTVTMGDNGSLLDDIFEVLINDQTILTSSVPVRSVSTTIQMSIGDHTIQMRGLAAPDGVGTYFIDVDGAELAGGPPTSGIDLVPGVTHTWTLRVGGN